MAGAPIIYFDRSIGRALPEALRMLGLTNVVHQHSTPAQAGLTAKAGQSSLFAQETPDDEWLEFVGKRGWIAFSQDYKMHREPAPLAAIRSHNVRMFYLWGAEAPRWDKMRCFAKAFDAVMKQVHQGPAPYVKRITRTGSLEDVL